MTSAGNEMGRHGGNQGGRTTIYTEELGDRICDILSTHTDCLDDLCKKYDDMPNPDTIYTWRHRHQSFAEKYLKAMHSRGNLYAEETIKIAAEKKTYIDGEGNEKIDPGMVAWQKMNVNLRIWHASKLAPKTYGDKNKEEEKDITSELMLEELKKLRAELADKNKKEF